MPFTASLGVHVTLCWKLARTVVAILASGALCTAGIDCGEAAAASPVHPAASPAVQMSRFTNPGTSVGSGPFTHLFSENVDGQPWYINDHTIIRATDGTWHLFGITHAMPADPNNEVDFAHATAPTLHGPWTQQPMALTADPHYYGETHLWAPYVMYNQGLYYMFYAGGGADHTQVAISLATSTDLYHWTKLPSGPLVRDGYDARDPDVLRVGNQWVLYYDATSNPDGGNHVVAYRTSTDLIHWSGRGIAYTDPTTGTGGGNTESPTVVYRGGKYYLFIGPRPGYVGTDVFASDDPYHFDPGQLAGHIDAHAAEVVRDTDGSWWVTGAGWYEGGVWLAPLNWSQSTSGWQITAPGYTIRIVTSPAPQIASWQIPLAGGPRDVLDDNFRGTVPYIGVNWFGDLSRPETPGFVHADPATGQLTISGIRMSYEPVAVDWSFNFGEETFDSSLTWHVATTLSNVYEVGLSLDTNLPTVGDNAGLNRAGDVPGFPSWTLAGDNQISAVMAYRNASAFATANHWFDPADGALSWQPLWSSSGTSWGAGDYPGGTWRWGISPKPHDTDYANSLAASVNAASVNAKPLRGGSVSAG